MELDLGKCVVTVIVDEDQHLRIGGDGEEEEEEEGEEKGSPWIKLSNVGDNVATGGAFTSTQEAAPSSIR